MAQSYKKCPKVGRQIRAENISNLFVFLLVKQTKNLLIKNNRHSMLIDFPSILKYILLCILFSYPDNIKKKLRKSA